jgi:dTDP-4-amino-4,6-dideoxygalactose transaminase
VIGSFGNAKPIDIGEGGFIATADEKIYEELSEMNMFYLTMNF